MARRRSRASEDTRAPRSSLPEPLPSSPHRPASHVFYCFKGEKALVVSWAARYAAYQFIAHLVEGEGPYKWTKRRTKSGFVIKHGVEFESGLRIEVNEPRELEETLEGPDPTEQESEYELPDPFPQQIEMLKHWDEARIEAAREKSLRGRKSRAGVDNKTPRPSKEGLTTIQSLGEELGIDPRECRVILRKHSSKPDAGWAWPEGEVGAIRDLLKKHRKAGP